MAPLNPCMTCGACCAHFRVSFYWGESDPQQGGSVPPSLTEEVTPFRRCMRGTNQAAPRCVALTGEIGRTVACSIYADRPTPCREFGVTFDDDGTLRFTPEDLARCTAARAAWGLPPLFTQSPEDHPTPDFTPAHHPPHRAA